MFFLQQNYATDQDVRSQTNTPMMLIHILRHKYATDQNVRSLTQIRHLFSGNLGSILVVRRLGREVNHSPPSSAEVKSEWS